MNNIPENYNLGSDLGNFDPEHILSESDISEVIYGLKCVCHDYIKQLTKPWKEKSWNEKKQTVISGTAGAIATIVSIFHDPGEYRRHFNYFIKTYTVLEFLQKISDGKVYEKKASKAFDLNETPSFLKKKKPDFTQDDLSLDKISEYDFQDCQDEGSIGDNYIIAEDDGSPLIKKISMADRKLSEIRGDNERESYNSFSEEEIKEIGYLIDKIYPNTDDDDR